MLSSSANDQTTTTTTTTPSRHRRVRSTGSSLLGGRGRYRSKRKIMALSVTLGDQIDMLEGEGQKETIRQVTYDERNHLSVLTQMHGSVWPSVWPFALVNVLVTSVVMSLKDADIDLTVNSLGHKYMSMMVSFLVVSRASITYQRFMEARSHLSDCYRCCRELMHHVAVLSMDDKSATAKKWRGEVAYRTILLLRVTMAVLEFQSTDNKPWEIEEMNDEDLQDLKDHLMLDETNDPSKFRVGRWAHGVRSVGDESFRAPIILAYRLRKEIMSQRAGGILQKRFKHVNLELKMLDYVTDYLKAFHGLKKLITTPFPFPLVQMARTFLFFWVFTLPFALCKSDREYLQNGIIIFFITYGFIGLEYVSMELDDPFGDDPMDFDDLGMAQMVFEDIYITLYKLDGPKSAFDVRKRIISRMKKGDALTNYVEEYGDGLKSPPSYRNDDETEE